MATASKVVDAILKEIISLGAETSPESEDTQDTLDAVNNFMTSLDADGVKLGFTLLNDLSDEVTIPLGALRGLIKNVAKDMAPQFGAPVTPALAEVSRSSLSIMYKLGVRRPISSLPSTLPVGSGNEDNFGFSRTFFPETEEEILSEQSGPIAVESGTQESVDG